MIEGWLLPLLWKVNAVEVAVIGESSLSCARLRLDVRGALGDFGIPGLEAAELPAVDRVLFCKSVLLDLIRSRRRQVPPVAGAAVCDPGGPS